MFPSHVPAPCLQSTYLRENCIAYSVIRLEVVNLLPEHQHPQVLAEELDHIQGVGEARAVFGEPVKRG